MKSARRHLLAAVLFAAALGAPFARAAEPAKAPAAKPEPIVLAAPASFAAAVAAVEKATGATGMDLPFHGAATEGRSFDVEPALAERLLTGSHEIFKKAGFYLFRYERSYGVAGEKDRLAVIGTPDFRTVVRKVGTAQAHHGVTTDKVIAWLDALQKEEPFDLFEVGVDYVAGRFDRTPKDPAAVARRCADFAPDLVAGRASTLDLLAHEIAQNRTLYLIW